MPNGTDRRRAWPVASTSGTALIGSGPSLLSIAVGKGSNGGWPSATTVGLFVAAFLVLGLWAAVELKTANPSIDLRVLRNAPCIGEP